MKIDDVKRIAVFAILMQNGEGVLYKSPEYMVEKFEKAMDMDIVLIAQLLDRQNRAILDQWLERWSIEEREEVRAYV